MVEDQINGLNQPGNLPPIENLWNNLKGHLDNMFYTTKESMLPNAIKVLFHGDEVKKKSAFI